VTSWETARNVAVRPHDGIQWYPGAINLLDKNLAGAFVELVDDIQPVLVVIDTLARSMVGGDENAARDVGQVIEVADRVRRASAGAVLIVHHTTKNGETVRGHSVLEGAADTLIECKSDGEAVALRCEKAKESAPFATIALRRVVVGESCVLDPPGGVGLAEEMVESERRLAGVLWDSFGTTGASSTDLREVAGMPKSSFYRALNSLLARGVVFNDGTDKRPLYRPVTEGAVE
jgi:hypothetical protein